ncbi:MAG: TonB-dependent receptor [candidate division WOR-3 bacterium]
MIWIIISDAFAKVCVKDESGRPVYGAYVRTKRDWELTGEDGCVNIKRDDSLFVSRVGYKTYKGVFKEEILLQSSPIILHPVEVSVEGFSQLSKIPFHISTPEDYFNIYEAGVSAYGPPSLTKVNIRGFDRKRYEVLLDGFVISDESSSEDHPLGIFPTNEVLGVIKGSAGSIFGGNSLGGALILENQKPDNGLTFKPKINISNLGFSLSGELSYGGERYGALISGAFRGLGDYIENSWDTTINIKGGLYYGGFSAYGYYKDQVFGIPLEESYSHNKFTMLYAKFKGLGFSYQNLDQREFEEEEETVIKQENFQGIYSTVWDRLGLYLRGFYGRFHTGDSLRYIFSSLRYVLIQREIYEIIGGLNFQFGNHPFIFGFLIGGNYDINNLFISGTISKSSRVPDLYERFFVGDHHALGRYDIGNPDLKPENSYEGQIGITINIKNIILSTNGYYNRVYGYIYPKNIKADTFKWENAEYVDFRGLEFESKVVIGRGILTSSITIPNNRLYNGDSVPYSPRPEISLGGEINLFGLTFKPFYRWNYAGFSIINISVLKNLGKFQISTGVNNLLNENYIEPTYPRRIPQPGRLFFLNLSASI